MLPPFIDVLLLIVIANAAPVLAAKLFRQRFTRALDLGCRLVDGQPILGPSKTWRGLLSSILLTSLAAWLLGYPALSGCWIALLSMLGDSCSSFIKRRLHRPSSSQFIGLDQIPESLLPAVVMAGQFGLDFGDVFWLVLIFSLVELSLARWIPMLLKR